MDRDEYLAEWKRLLERVVIYEQADTILTRDINQSLDLFESEMGEWGSCDPGSHDGWTRTVDTPHGPASVCLTCRNVGERSESPKGVRRAA